MPAQHKTVDELREELQHQIIKLRSRIRERFGETLEAANNDDGFGAFAHMLSWGGDLFEDAAKFAVYGGLEMNIGKMIENTADPVVIGELSPAEECERRLKTHMDALRGTVIEAATRGTNRSSSPTSNLMDDAVLRAQALLVRWYYKEGLGGL